MSILWNVFNTHQLEILFQRQRTVEKHLQDLDPSLSLDELSVEPWWTRLIHLIQEYFTDAQSQRSIYSTTQVTETETILFILL